MKTFFLVLVVAIAVNLALSETQYSDSDRAEWSNYKIQHGKSYEDPAEDARRFGIYMDTKKLIAEHNAKFKAGEVSYTLGINQFADQLPEELPHNRHLPRPSN